MKAEMEIKTGYIYSLVKNRKFGFISVDGELDNYYFTNYDLENCNILNLQGGETVEFVPYENYRGKAASCVRVKYQIDPRQSIPSPGINSHVDLNRTPLNEDEKQIIINLSTVFYVTSGGDEIKLNEAKYRYSLIKPTEFFVNNFQMFRELVVVFSDYVHFEPRSFDAAPEVYKLITTPLRLDKGCHLLICHDDQVEEKIARCLKDSNVNQIVIPFTYSELLRDKNPENLIQERFRKYLFNSDLFSTLTPITDQNFFFGRRDLVQDIVSKCKNKGHCGIFGLRRSGKTSVLYAITSLLKNDDYNTVFIPCEGELRTLDWRMALHLVVKNIYKALHFSEEEINEKVKESNYNSFNTTMYFEDDMNRVLQTIDKPVIIMFDEIEAITFNVSRGNETDNLWLDGKGFLNFWNTIKGYYSKHPGKISIVVAGTNPMINEEPVIGKTKEPNPMFSQLSSPNQGEYLQAFTIDDTANMVNTLGSYMGLKFDQYSIDKLTYDCGGHPYLMRMLCSHINKYIKMHGIEKPYTITKAVYDKASAEFEKSSDAESFFEMILNILMTSYHMEYETLKILATQGDDIVSRIQDKKALHHLFGYGLIESSQNNYAIKYDIIKRYLNEQYKFERTDLTVEQQRQEIEFRLGKAEITLRKTVRNTLAIVYNKARARQAVLAAMQRCKVSDNAMQIALGLDYEELFDPSKNNVFFNCLRSIIVNNFAVFQNLFEGYSNQDVEKHLSALNLARRCPAHSYDEGSENWTSESFSQFRESMSWLEAILKNFS